MHTKIIVTGVASAALALALLTVVPNTIGTDQAKAGLTPVSDCDALLDRFRTQAGERVTAYGLIDSRPELAIDMAEAPTALDSASGAEGSPTAARQFTGTNNQEVGVDEADIVKTDGRLIITVDAGMVRIFEVTETEASGGEAFPEGTGGLAQIASMDVAGFDHRLLLDGEHLLVLARDSERDSEEGTDRIRPGRWMGTPKLRVTEFDLSDPARPRRGDQVEADGEYVDARLIDGTARIVTSTNKAPDFPEPAPLESPLGDPTSSSAERLVANRTVIDDSTLADWLPALTVNGEERSAAECASVLAPSKDSGFGTLSVLTVNPDATGRDSLLDTTTILADGQDVYANAQNLYVATQRHAGPEPSGGMPESAPSTDLVPPPEILTDIHRFDISTPHSRYAGSGTVTGSLLNQFSMSESRDVLRVATTSGQSWDRTSESHVTTLAIQDGDLPRLGRVSDLGRGEQIHSVRMIDDTAYVVTFRQTDPLYVVDLSDPTRPTVSGELKIPGYSAYLHPVGEDLILGVGQDATDTGRRMGTQVSLFDVSRPTSPMRVDQWRAAAGSHSEVEQDHHAFLFEPQSGTLIVPVAGPYGDTGLQVLRLRDARLQAEGTITPPEATGWGPKRSLIIDQGIYTVGDQGIGVNDLQTLERIQWVPNR